MRRRVVVVRTARYIYTPDDVPEILFDRSLRTAYKFATRSTLEFVPRPLSHRLRLNGSVASDLEAT